MSRSFAIGFWAAIVLILIWYFANRPPQDEPPLDIVRRKKKPA